MPAASAAGRCPQLPRSSRETINVASTLHPDQPALAPPREPKGEPSSRVELPQISAFMAKGFNRYLPRYLSRHFNAVRIVKDSAPSLRADEPVICFANHPGWWDPLMAFLLNRLYMAPRTVYAPIDESALAQYPVFRKLGFYGIDLNSANGARRFLSTTRALLEQPTTAIWITPGGKFCDVRARTTFQPGLVHLAANLDGVPLVPLAIEYTFWEERTPEALVEFGSPLRASRGTSKSAWQEALEGSLAATQASLAEKAIARRPEQFDVPLDGSAGVGGWYDLLRRARSLLTGKGFDPRHHRDDRGNRADD